MPYCEIDVNNLNFLSLFGFQILSETDVFYSVKDFHGRHCLIDKKRPFIWFDDEDLGEAIQMGVKSIVTCP